MGEGQRDHNQGRHRPEDQLVRRLNLRDGADLARPANVRAPEYAQVGEGEGDERRGDEERTCGRITGRCTTTAANVWRACGRGSTWRGRAVECERRSGEPTREPAGGLVVNQRESPRVGGLVGREDRVGLSS